MEYSYQHREWQIGRISQVLEVVFFNFIYLSCADDVNGKRVYYIDV